MKRLFSIILLLLAPVLLIAGEGAVILSEQVDITIDADGRATRHVTQKIQLNTFRTLRSLGEWFHVYNPELEELEVIRSVTTMVDGTKVPMPNNAMLDQSPYATQDAPDFSGIRERMVSRTGLEPGCIVEFEYETRDKIPHRMLIVEPMCGNYRIVKKQVTVTGRGFDVVTGGTVTADGSTYAVTDRAALMEGIHADIDGHDLLVIKLKDPLAALKARLTAATDLEQTLATMKLGKTATAGRVVLALEQLLERRLDTVELSPALMASDRSADTIVSSGYATPFEKARIAHAVLDRYTVDHDILLIDERGNGLPLLTHPEFIVVTDTLLWPSTVEMGNRSVFSLLGERTIDAATDLNLSVQLTQTGETFTGDAILDIRSPFAQTGIRSMLPLTGLKAENHAYRVRTMEHLVETADLTWKWDNNTITCVNILDRLFQLARLNNYTLVNNRLALKTRQTGQVDIAIRFEKAPDLTLPAPLEAATPLGHAGINWNLEGTVLHIRFVYNCNPFALQKDEFHKLEKLLVPILTHTSLTAFVN